MKEAQPYGTGSGRNFATMSYSSKKPLVGGRQQRRCAVISSMLGHRSASYWVAGSQIYCLWSRGHQPSWLHLNCAHKLPGWQADGRETSSWGQ